MTKLLHKNPTNFNMKKPLKQTLGPYDLMNKARVDYLRKLSIRFPNSFLHLYEMLHFNATFDVVISLDKFKLTTVHLIEFGNNFLEMISLFRNLVNIDLPRLHQLEFPMNYLELRENVLKKHRFDFGLPFDWRWNFNFVIDFSDSDFKRLRGLFRHLPDVFLQLSSPNIDFQQLFLNILPKWKIKFQLENLVIDTAGSGNGGWLRQTILDVYRLLNKADSKLLDLSKTSIFLQQIGMVARHFSNDVLAKFCKLHSFMLKTGKMLHNFGENLETNMIVETTKLKNELSQAISEIVNVSLFVDERIDATKHKIADTVHTFVDKFLSKVEDSLGNIKGFSDIIEEFVAKSTKKLSGFCYKNR